MDWLEFRNFLVLLGWSPLEAIKTKFLIQLKLNVTHKTNNSSDFTPSGKSKFRTATQVKWPRHNMPNLTNLLFSHAHTYETTCSRTDQQFPWGEQTTLYLWTGKEIPTWDYYDICYAYLLKSVPTFEEFNHFIWMLWNTLPAWK